MKKRETIQTSVAHKCEQEKKLVEFPSMGLSMSRGLGTGWAQTGPLFSLTFIEKGHLPTHFLLPVE